jgi:hypothetical protein
MYKPLQSDAQMNKGYVFDKARKSLSNEADWGAYSMVNLFYRQVKLTRHDFSQWRGAWNTKHS